MSIAGLQRNPDRDQWDFYPTEEHHTRALLRHLDCTTNLDFEKTAVWECAAGDGAMSDVLATRFRRVVSTDVRPMRDDVKAADFLTAKPPRNVDWIITNPPFALFSQFAARCRELGLPHALVMPVHYLAGLARRDGLWLAHPPDSLLLIPRNMKVHDKTSQFAHLWAVWLAGERPQWTSFYWSDLAHPNETRPGPLTRSWQ